MPSTRSQCAGKRMRQRWAISRHLPPSPAISRHLPPNLTLSHPLLNVRQRRSMSIRATYSSSRSICASSGGSSSDLSRRLSHSKTSSHSSWSTVRVPPTHLPRASHASPARPTQLPCISLSVHLTPSTAPALIAGIPGALEVQMKGLSYELSFESAAAAGEALIVMEGCRRRFARSPDASFKTAKTPDTSFKISKGPAAPAAPAPTQAAPAAPAPTEAAPAVPPTAAAPAAPEPAPAAPSAAAAPSVAASAPESAPTSASVPAPESAPTSALVAAPTSAPASSPPSPPASSSSMAVDSSVADMFTASRSTRPSKRGGETSQTLLLTDDDWSLLLAGAVQRVYTRGEYVLLPIHTMPLPLHHPVTCPVPRGRYVLREGVETSALYHIAKGSLRVELRMDGQDASVVRATHPTLHRLGLLTLRPNCLASSPYLQLPRGRCLHIGGRERCLARRASSRRAPRPHQ